MNTANFYPGPSRVYSNVPEYIYEAYMQGVMSMNHRSPECMELVSETKMILREKLRIPAAYEIAFTSSATENWEIIAQSLTEKGSFHFYNGAFGQKWFGYADKITKAKGVKFDINDELPQEEVGEEFDVIALTHNETSTGTKVSAARMAQLRSDYPEHIITVDVTSSLGGERIDFDLADYWYASVQKCLGLPAGLGLMILSPAAMEKAYVLSEKGHYNSLVNILENTRHNQTQYTPNVLGIYLLNRTQRISKGIDAINKKLQQRITSYHALVNDLEGIEFLISNEKVRSQTVLTLKCDDPAALRAEAKDHEIILGAGYGDLKPHTFRIANFPAIKGREIDKLMTFLRKKFA
ncbi:aminotransferase class V-fold PLP-dependent enzyme [Marinoscillum sp. MHG1-6]|uniref:aminotransferase class V-fold PLP-dependent enzyme n=1 Tax=Marinoscillum sp. MHG1-6 TaxID=2959627 RepID=UPI0021570AEF|nr:aminotransferase class V-fold PLP-dependent enzyme [Marinoscillum sp. MHG1-6]